MDIAPFLKWTKNDIIFNTPRTDPADTRWSSVYDGSAPITKSNSRQKIKEGIARLPEQDFIASHEKDIVISGGGLRYLPSAWIAIRMLRYEVR